MPEPEAVTETSKVPSLDLPVSHTGTAYEAEPLRDPALSTHPVRVANAPIHVMCCVFLH